MTLSRYLQHNLLFIIQQSTPMAQIGWIINLDEKASAVVSRHGFGIRIVYSFVTITLSGNVMVALCLKANIMQIV